MPDFRTSISPLCLLRLIWKILLLIKKYYFIQVWHFIFYSFLQPEELTLMVENVLQDSTTTTTSLTSHDSSIRPKLNNSKNMEPSAHQSRGGAELLNFKNNCLKMVNNNLAKCNQRIPPPQLASSIGKKWALKKYDWFGLNTSCFWGCTRSNITPVKVVQFHEIFVTKIMNKFIYF